jgi:hypothetical protein
MKVVAASKIRIVMSAALVAATIVGTAAPSFAKTFAQVHPRRAEVLRRDNNINGRSKANYGHLSGHYGQLESEDASIRSQEQHDAFMNGGYITRGEKKQLNREENRLNHQITKDE